MGKRNKSHRQGKNMSKEVKPMRGMRLSLIARKANLSIDDIVNLLESNGYGNLDSNPNTKITIDWIRGINEVYPLGFGEDKNLSEYPIKKLDVIPPLEKRRTPTNFSILFDALRKSYAEGVEIESLLKEAERKVEETKKEAEEAKKVADVTEKKLQKVVKENKALKSGKYKRSGHLTDQMLKYSYPKESKRQLSIFDSLGDATKKAIETVGGIEVTEIVEGIKLTPSETKVIDCLCKLLHENSQNFEPKNEDYYSGNKGLQLVEFGGDSTPAPKLAFTLYELTKEYKAGEYVGGKDIDNVKQILTELDNKKFLLSYVETTKTKGGGRVERKIEDFRKLIHIVKLSQTEINKEEIELSKMEETIVILNPIFRRQIDSKFILYPNDINKRTIIAYGSHNLSDIALRLRDYLIRELSSKRTKSEIGQEKLYYLLAEKWMKESRKKKVKEYTEKAIETVKTLGLIETYEIKTGATGEPKVVFTLNKDWE
jgi:hypothetical protein